MDAELIEKLRQRALQKRGVLLKDCTPSEFLIACDWAEERVPAEDKTPWNPSYLKYASQAHITALRSRLPSCERILPIPNGGSRVVVLFRSTVLWEILKFLTGKNWRKYSATYHQSNVPPHMLTMPE